MRTISVGMTPKARDTAMLPWPATDRSAEAPNFTGAVAITD
jgi:hypothetical protein